MLLCSPVVPEGGTGLGGMNPERSTVASVAVRASARPLGRNAAVLFAGTLASRLLGMLRESVIAATFDVASTDAFFIAWRFPNALRALLAEGAATNALHPIFAAALRQSPQGDRARLRAVVARVRGVALVVLTVTSVLGVLAARPLFRLMAGDFSGDVTRFELGVSLLRILFPFVFFMGWFAIGDAALRIVDRFQPGAMGGVLQNLSFLLAPFVLVPLLSPLGVPAIHALAIAALLGGVLQVVWLRPELARQGLRSRPVFELDDSVRQLGRLFLPLLYGQAVYQVNVIVAGRLLSGLSRGSASFFSYAQRLADVPQGLFTISLAGAAAAALAHQASERNLQGVARTYESALRMAAFVAIPSSVLLAVYGEAVIPLVFRYGHFRQLGDRGVHEIAASLRWQAVSVSFMAFVHQTTAVFAAFRRRADVVKIATVSLAVFVITGVLATRAWGHVGVAAAMAASSAAQLALLFWSVRRLIPVRFGAVGPSLAKVLAATGFTALAARAAVWFLPVTGVSLGARVLAVVVGIALVVLYLLAAWVLRCDEMVTVQNELRVRLARWMRRG